MKPFFSIITPTYNRPDLLEKMIMSVLSQTFQNWELIIIDDSTNNDTEKRMCENISDPRIIYRKNEKNVGAPESRNRGMDISTGTWITFLDDDDTLYDETSLEIVQLKLNETKSPWIVYKRVDGIGNSLTHQLAVKDSYNWTKDCLFGKSFRGDAAHFIDRNLIAGVRNYGSGRSEWQFWYKLAQKSNFIYIPLAVQIGGYLENGLMSSYVSKKQTLYLFQQLCEVLQRPTYFRYVPLATLRLVLHVTGLQRLRLWLTKRTNDQTLSRSEISR